MPRAAGPDKNCGMIQLACKGLRTLKRLGLFLATAKLAATCGGAAAAAEPPATPAPLYHEATNEFARMKVTQYRHATRIDAAAGSYYYDCVGFVSHALHKAAPQAWKSLATKTALAPHHTPSPSMYRTFLAGLAAHPQPGWEAVTNAAELRPGDVVAWKHKTATATGHAVIIGSLPVRGPDNSWVVQVYDSTSTPHGDDSRLDDPRAQKADSSGKPSGLGHGVMVFVADAPGGAITGLRWSPRAKTVTVPIAGGRPTG